MRLVSFTLNGKPARLAVNAERPFLWVLRDDLGLTGTKYGCGEGHCGSCTVLVDNEAVRACTTTVADIEGRKVLTIEGLAANGRPHPIQQAFVRHAAFQCGYCTPGMILGAYAFLLKNPRPTRAQIVTAMEPHLCRCAAHLRIVQAIEAASVQMKGEAL